MTSGHRAIALVALWVSVGGAISVVASLAFMGPGTITVVLVSIIAAAGVAATWLITRGPVDQGA